MSDYFGAAMRLTLEHLVDWETLLAHRRGERIDVAAELGAFTTLLETETTLALPMKPLCREDCRGLCPVCGGNRNVTACACETHVPDPRWTALKGWAERAR